MISGWQYHPHAIESLQVVDISRGCNASDMESNLEIQRLRKPHHPNIHFQPFWGHVFIPIQASCGPRKFLEVLRSCSRRFPPFFTGGSTNCRDAWRNKEAEMAWHCGSGRPFWIYHVCCKLITEPRKLTQKEALAIHKQHNKLQEASAWGYFQCTEAQARQTAHLTERKISYCSSGLDYKLIPQRNCPCNLRWNVTE